MQAMQPADDARVLAMGAHSTGYDVVLPDYWKGVTLALHVNIIVWRRRQAAWRGKKKIK